MLQRIGAYVVGVEMEMQIGAWEWEDLL